MEELAYQTIYVDVLSCGLFMVGVWHIVAGPTTERVFRQARYVRMAGIMFLLVALPCILWPTPYFMALGVGLVASGLLRAATPELNIRLESKVMPRWGHGCVIITFSLLVWLAYRWSR